MSAPSHSEYDLSRREEMSVSGAVLAGAPWGTATASGAVVAAGDLGLHLVGSGLGFGAVGGSLSMGVVAFFVVAAAKHGKGSAAEGYFTKILGIVIEVAVVILATARFLVE